MTGFGYNINGFGIVASVAGGNIPLSVEYEQYDDVMQYVETKADPFNENRWISIWVDDHGSKKINISVITRDAATLTFSDNITPYTGAGDLNYSSPGISWDSAVEDQFIFVFNNSTNQGSARIGTISGSAGSESISFGTELSNWAAKQLLGGDPGTTLLDLGSGNFCCVWADASTYYPYARILTTSGTDVSAGGSNTIISSTAIKGRINDSCTNSSDGTRILTGAIRDSDGRPLIWDIAISGTTITPGTTQVVADVAYDQWMAITSLGVDTFIFAAEDNSNNYVYCYHGTRASANSFTWGTRVAGFEEDARAWAIDNNTATSDFVIMAAASSSYPVARVGSVDGTTLTFGTAGTLSSTNNGQYYHMICQSSADDGGFTTQWRPSGSGSTLRIVLNKI